jgi:hypothetical protein
LLSFFINLLEAQAKPPTTIMPVANNIFTGAILAPFVTILAAISLGAVQRAIEYVAFVAKNPQK